MTRLEDDDRPEQGWDLIEELGGEEALEALLQDLYDRLYEDLLVGFFFAPHDKRRLIAHQRDYVRAHLGRRARGARYTGRSLLQAHAHLPILAGHFDRRHKILKSVLEAHNVVEHVTTAWLELDASARALILKRGAESARALNGSDQA